jgi:type IV pilus assembly protein PilM
MPHRITAARAQEKSTRLEVFTSRKLAPGVVAPSLSGNNILDREALGTALRNALQVVSGKSRDVSVILPDAAIRVLLLDFEVLPARAVEFEPVIRFRLKKSLPFDVEQAAVSCDIRRVNGSVHVVAAVSPRSIIDDYESVFRELGYSPGLILPSSLAALGMIEGERPTLLLKVDPMNIIIATAHNRELRLIRTLENPQGTRVTAGELVEAVLPSVVFFEDTFGAPIEQIWVAGFPANEIGPLLKQQTAAEVRELAPELSPEQNLSGEDFVPSALAGIAGSLLG